MGHGMWPKIIAIIKMVCPAAPPQCRDP